MDTFTAEIEEMTATAREAFESAQTVINNMPDGGRIQIKDLAKSVGQALSKDPKEVLGFVNHFVHRTKIAYVTRGKNGGIVKGIRPIKVVRSPKKVKVDLPATLTSSDGAAMQETSSDMIEVV